MTRAERALLLEVARNVARLLTKDFINYSRGGLRDILELRMDEVIAEEPVSARSDNP